MSRLSQVSSTAIITVFLTTVGVSGWAQAPSAPGAAVNTHPPSTQQGVVIKDPFKEGKSPCGGKGKGKGEKSGERGGKGSQVKTLGGNPLDGLNVSKSPNCP